ncbi:MAG: hypothetical protein IJ896_14935 [Fibrobacter sp.]|nr:hypothetical protein [Fibrobacter sp.]
MKKSLWLGMVLTAAACLVACDDDTGANSQDPLSSENDISANSGNEDNPGNVGQSSESLSGSSSSVEKSTEPGDGSSSSVKSTGKKGSSSSAESETESLDGEAEKVWSWDTPKENFLNPKIIYKTFVDSKRDNKTYKVIEYSAPGFQGLWFAENLNYEMEGSWCYDEDPKKCNVAGRLYTWDAAMKACPEGWRLPNDEDWKALFGTDMSVAGTRLKSLTGWTDEERHGVYVDYNGEDRFGFSAIPAGLWNGQDYCNAGSVAFFWSSSEEGDDKANSVVFAGNPVDDKKVVLGAIDKSDRFSVRCVQDKQGGN